MAESEIEHSLIHVKTYKLLLDFADLFKQQTRINSIVFEMLIKNMNSSRMTVEEYEKAYVNICADSVLKVNTVEKQT